jgi:hypothetical protein
MNELFSFCDDHLKIFILIWLKLREYYLESKNKQLSLPYIIKKTLNFLKKIRKQCKQINRFRKIAKFVYFLEIELGESDKFIEKLQHFAIFAEIFDLPEPFIDIIKSLGLNSGDDEENNLFTKKINDLFKNIDDIDLEKKVNIIEDTLQEEGTLINFLKNKKQDNPNSKLEYEPKIKKIIPKIIPKNIPKNIPEDIPEDIPKKNPEIVYNSPIQIINNNYSSKNINISKIPRLGATPNPSTIYRLH